jgi:hypothetical protein
VGEREKKLRMQGPRAALVGLALPWAAMGIVK